MSAVATVVAWERGDDHFDGFADEVRRRVAAAGSGPFFATDAADLWWLYLDAFDPADRQSHDCHACRRFIETYGGLVTIAPDGGTEPLCWGMPVGSVPEVYQASVAAMCRAVRRANVTGVYLDARPFWGTSETPDVKRGITWRHQHVRNPAQYRERLLFASQAMAEKREEHDMLVRALHEFPVDIVRQAKALLETDSLYRSEKCLGVAKWLLALHEQLATVRGPKPQDAMVWRAVAKAAPGWCHVRTTMIGTLLEDLASGLPVADAARKFAAKMHPLSYQRPQAPPTAGNLAEAEKVVAKLGIAPALARRFARLEDIVPMWTPKQDERHGPKPAGVFSHLRVKDQGGNVVSIGVPPIVMTWDKFARTVLPTAERIECMVPSDRAGFVALVTAADPTALPILQWDREDKRNPVTWYFYTTGSLAHDWNLRAGTWAPVNAVTLNPAQWDAERPCTNQAKAAVLILDGARDLRHEHGGGLFVENLRSEYHGIRATLEAHFGQARIEGRDEATACGLALQHGSNSWGHVLRVTAGGVAASYKLDRWD